MAPRIKYSQDDIIDAAFALVRREGWAGLSARSIARELNASTRPIYSSMDSMHVLEDAVVRKALDLYVTYLTREYTGDPWVDNGIGFILFARDEKQLFLAINDERHTQIQRKHSREVWSFLAETLNDYPPFAGLDEEVVMRIRVSRWMLLHGMASLITNGWMQLDEANRIIIGGKKTADLDRVVRTVSEALRIGLTAEGAFEDGEPDSRQ